MVLQTSDQAERIKGLSVLQLEELAEGVLDFTTIANVVDWLVQKLNTKMD